MNESLAEVYERARRHANASDWQAAGRDVETLLTFGGNDAASINLATMILFRSGAADRAIGLLRAAVERMPNDASLVGNLANALYESGAHRESLEWHASAVALDATNPGLQLNRAIALRGAGEREQAIEAL
ncbi:MAG: hypothetical protein SGJ07_12200, partial [Rhodospirillaceae bacterium]|nr:hypothetical protein [Rhodospirillaceae bacterium]